MSFDYSRLTATCAVDSPDKAITLPPEAYGSDELYAAEVDRIFKRGWVPLCRVEQVPTPGSLLQHRHPRHAVGGHAGPAFRDSGAVAQLLAPVDGGV